MTGTFVALACTGDPLLDALLAECKAFRLAPETGETIEDLTRLAGVHRPALVFISPAIGAPGRPLTGFTMVCLAEEEEQALSGVPACVGRPLTPEGIDDWVRTQIAGAAAPARAPAAAAPPKKPTAGFRAPSIPEPTSAPGTVPVTGPAPRRPGAPGKAPPAVPAPTVSVLRQRIVALWGGKPGAGRSTLAVGLSDLLSQLGNVRVCTVDLNPHNSSLATLVGKDEEPSSWFHLAEALSRGSPAWTDALRWVNPNWAVLTGPAGNQEWIDLIGAETIDWLVDGLRSQFDYILLDLEARPGPVCDTALRLAQTVLVVVSPDFPDVLDTRRALGQAEERRILDRTRCRLVLNRWIDTAALPAATVSEFLGLSISARVPAGSESVIEAAAQGLPVTRLTSTASRPVTQAMGQTMQLIAEAVSPGRTGVGAQLFGLFNRASLRS